MKDSFKASIRIPTAEPYAYLEIEAEGAPEAIWEAYERFKKLTKVGVGLETKEWNKVLDIYREGGGMSEEVLSRMDEQQRWLIHELDKSDSRMA